MDLNLQGKVGIVTGASRGIGQGIAECLAAEGMRLVVTARSGDALHQVSSVCGKNTKAFVTDLRESDAPNKLINYCLTEFGTIDLLVNNAGATKRGDFLKLTDDDWQDGFALKFYGYMRCSRAAWPHLMKSGGSIVNIIGIGGRTGSAEFAIGGAVNSALMNLTKVLADRGTLEGVRVNAINPGSIVTDRLQIRLAKFASDRGMSVEQAAIEMAREMGIARFGEVEEIARTVAFLASSHACYCHGAILDIDGGQTRTL